MLLRNYALFTVCMVLFCQISIAAPHTEEDTKEFWLSDGYGLLIQKQQQELRAFEITSISCILGWKAQRVYQPEAKEGAAYEGRERYLLMDGPDGTKKLHMEGTVSDILLHRVSALPRQCSLTPQNTPQTNYAIFWQTFAEQYGFFALHKVDWNAIDKNFRPQVTATTDPKDLFRIFTQMLGPLQDTHTVIFARNIGQEYEGTRSDSNQLEDEAWKRAEEIIVSRYLHSSLRSFCKGRLQFGMLAHSIAYLRITAFYGYADSDNYEHEIQALQSALDEIFSNANKMRGLVIDIRLNHGGDDPLGVEIASRLTATRYLAYSKVARNNLTGPLHYTQPQKTWVEPSQRPGFHGPVVVLTGPDTVSAGETFTMALMGRTPHIQRIGLNTQGVFSDVLKRTLPNGWIIHLPNEVYWTRNHKAFDATGVPPDIPVRFFSEADLHNGYDAALETALRSFELH